VRRTIPGILLAGLIAQGCVTSGPPANVGFKQASELEEFEGVYRNAGEVKEGYPKTYLSALIWPDSNGVPHETVSRVEVRGAEKNALNVRAWMDTVLIREQTFARGKDFDVKEGRLLIRHHVGAHANNKSGDPFLGFEGHTVELGLDRRGEGKSRETTQFAGLVYLVMPIAMSEAREARFVRIAP